jgi:hypothetical protein
VRAHHLRPPTSDAAEAFKIEISREEMLEDLCWPNSPPGQWRIEEPLEAIERRRRPRRAA